MDGPGVGGIGKQIEVTQRMVRGGVGNGVTLPVVWPLTSADRLTLDTGYALDACWLYSKRLDDVVVARGLSLLLQDYQTFAGRYSSRRGGIELNDEGCTFTVAHDPDWTVARFLANEHALEPGRFIDYSSSVISMKLAGAPLMRVKLTYLSDGGSVLGVCASHGVCDGDTFYTMMSRWAAIARGVQGEKPVLDQRQIPYHPARRTRAEVLAAMNRLGWAKIDTIPAAARLGVIVGADGILLHNHERTRPFHFSAAALKRLKTAAERDALARMGTQFVTTNEALSSFLCQLTLRLFDFPDATQCGHSTMLNWRGRYPGLSLQFAGNASSAMKTCDFFAGSSLGQIAGNMHEGLEPFKSGTPHLVEHVHLFLDVHENGLAAHMADPSTLPYLSRQPTTAVTNNFSPYAQQIYGLDFGAGKPLCAVPHHCGDQVVIWPALASETGVYCYFQGSTAIAIERLPKTNPFFREIRKFDAELSDQDVELFFGAQANREFDVDKKLSPIHVGRFFHEPTATWLVQLASRWLS